MQHEGCRNKCAGHNAESGNSLLQDSVQLIAVEVRGRVVEAAAQLYRFIPIGE